MKTDVAFLLEVLSDGEPHAGPEILRRSIAERGAGMTVHSRASDLRKQGYQVRAWPTSGRGRRAWLYQLVALPAENAEGFREQTGSGTTASALSAGRPSTSTTSPPRTAGAPAARRLSDLDRVAAEAHIVSLLAPAFEPVDELPASWLVDDGSELELRDDELADELAEQQRALFLSEAA